MLRKLASSVVLYTLACGAQASTYNFSCITNNSATDCGTGETQTAMEVVNLGGNQVEFVFSMQGTHNASIAEIYFYDGTLLGIASINDNPAGGVDYYEQTSRNQKLPGIGYGPTKAFAAVDAANPAPFNGVNPSEQVGIVFDLQAGLDYNDVITALSIPYDPSSSNGALLVGIHVTAFDSGGSESLIHHAVPLPAAAWLFGSALMGLGLRLTVKGDAFNYCRPST